MDVDVKSPSKPIVFVGPSLPIEEARRYLDAEFRPPCRRGDLVNIEPGRVVGIIDGVFHQQLAISPREIARAIDRGVVVFGASSMGALRAVEVPEMIGVGRVYELYQDGVIDSDDEVAIRFDPARLVPLTVPLVNVRYSVERLTQSGSVADDTGDRLLKAARRLHYTDRTYANILCEAGLSGKADSQELLDLLSAFDLKHDDAIRLLERVAATELGTGGTHHKAESTVPPTGGPAAALRAANSSKRRVTRTGTEPILIWETGDVVQLHELMTFLKLTGRFIPYAHNVMVSMLQRDRSLRDMFGTDVSKQVKGLVKQAFIERCRSWGWNTPEEMRVSLDDLGLNVRSVFRQLHAEFSAATALARIGNAPDSAIANAFKAELFLNDIALKREAMVLGSLRTLAERAAQFDQPGVDWARSLICRLHGVFEWNAVERAILSLGVTAEEISEFLRTLAAAATMCRVDAASSPHSEQVWDPADVKFGLSRSPKPQGEARFSTEVSVAYEHARRLRDVIGITRVGMINGLADIGGVFVSQAARPRGSWSSSYGSGKSDSAEGAFIGGVMEEVEKWAQEQFTPEPIVASYRELSERRATLRPEVLDLPYDTLYTPQLSIPWCECVDLLSGERLLVPLAAVAAPAVAGRNNVYYSPRGGRVVFGTNGLASGFTLAEAVVHAACECVERHAAKLEECRVSNPGVRRSREWPRPIDTSTLPHTVHTLLDHLRAASYAASLWNITSAIRIPTVHARIQKAHVSFDGWAAHPNAAVACHMATLEACQSVIGNIAGGREDLSVRARSLGRHERPRPQRTRGALSADSVRQSAVKLADLDNIVTTDIRDELTWIRHTLLAAGVDRMLCVDLSHEAIAPVRVVRIVIPGIETTNPFHCGLWARRVLAGDILLQ